MTIEQHPELGDPPDDMLVDGRNFAAHIAEMVAQGFRADLAGHIVAFRFGRGGDLILLEPEPPPLALPDKLEP